MGLVPVGESAPGRRYAGDEGRTTPVERLNTDVVLMARAQVAFLFCGAIVGVLGVILPHPDSFLTTELLLLNCVSWTVAGVTWVLAPKISFRMLRFMPAAGTLLITVSVIFSRDPTSAYALLYLFPCVYVYYFLTRIDAALHIAFAALNYVAAILIISAMPGAPELPSGSVFHHLVITIGTLVVVGAMLLFLRRRVEALVDEMIEAARTDLSTGLLNGRGFGEILTREIERARLGAHRVSILTIQLSGVREAQKHLSMEEGEEIFKRFATLLEDSTRRMDPVARTGTWEFSVALPETDESTAFLLAEQILGRGRRSFREAALPVSAGIGVASFPKHAASAEGLSQAGVAAAEAAMKLGTDRAVVFSAELEDVLANDRSSTLKDQRTHLSTVLSLAEVLDLRDARTASHSMAVARYCEMLGRELQLPEQRISRLRLAGLLHDIGKVGIADSILDKPGPLSPAEWDEVRRHPELAGRILGARELADIREWILCRHEQPDGHGYPRGLSGDSIPLEAKIVAVAESYDAMTSERPYRPAMSREEAIAELGRYAGSQFDGAVVDAMVRALDSAEHELPLSG